MKFTKADRMCFAKRRYPNQIKAACAIGTILGRDPNAPRTLRAYECPVCRGWHITKEQQDNPEYQKRRWMAGMDVRNLVPA